ADRPGTLRKEFPDARWYTWEPAGRGQALEGARQAFGEPLGTLYHFDKADVVLSLDADFLSCGPAHLHHVHDFMSKRRGREKGEGAKRNRLYVVETMPSTTGAVADHRLPLLPASIEGFARAAKEGLFVIESGTWAEFTVEQRRWAVAMVKDLQAHPG